MNRLIVDGLHTKNKRKTREKTSKNSISQPPWIRGESKKMKIYWIFKNEPSAEISEYRANTKTEALKMYNADHETNLKIKKENPFSAVCIAEKTAYLHYNFRLFSYAE